MRPTAATASRHARCYYGKPARSSPRTRRRGEQICALASYETDDHQQDDGADHRVDDRADEACERHETQLPQQPDADEGADDAQDDVPEQSESKPAHELPGRPARDSPEG